MEALHRYFKGKDMQVVASPALDGCHDGISVEVNTKVLYSQTQDQVAGIVQFELNNQAQDPNRKKEDRILVCQGPSCSKKQGQQILSTLEKNLANSDFKIQSCGCTGNCSQANNIVVNGRLIQLQNVRTAEGAVKREMERQKLAGSNELVSANDIESILGI